MNNRKISLSIRILVCVVALLFTHILSFSQSLPLKHYSSKDGLPSSRVTCIVQDSHGFLWFGTEQGLSRFNSRIFQNFSDEKHGLRNDYITALLEDQRGTLWVTTRGSGLIHMTQDGVVIKTYTTRDGLPTNRISSITMDPEGNLWLGTNLGVCFFDGKTFTVYSRKDGLIDDYVNTILMDKKGRIWIGTGKGLICLFVDRKNSIRSFINFTGKDGLVNEYINALMLDHDGNIWVGTKGGVNCCKVEDEKLIVKSYSTKNGMSHNSVNAIIEDRDRKLWIATENGLSIFSSGKFSNYYAKDGLLHDKFYTLFQDNEGNIWIGTRMGVSRLNSLQILNYSFKEGLPDNVIWAIVEEKEGKYWIGTDNGVSCYSGEKFKTYTTNDGLISNTIYNLLKNRAGNIWIATDIGLCVYSPWDGKFTGYPLKGDLLDETVLSLEEDRDGTIWIGTTKGLWRFIHGQIKPHGLNITVEPLAIHAILNDKNGNLWFSDTKGLWKITGERSTHYLIKDGLIGDQIYSLMEDSKGRIWIGTERGLGCYSNGKFTGYSKTSGLSDNDCLFTLEDNNGNLWIGTKNGLNRFDGKSFKIYTSRDGLRTNEMNHCTCLKDSRGYLWVGTLNGMSRIDPRLEIENTFPPPVYITQFSVMEEDRPISNDIRLKHDENYIKFSYIGLCYTSPDDVKYKYKLEGTDKKWYENSAGYISYPSLQPGNYIFKVIAKNNDGKESLYPAELRFEILPPFWMTWWFRTAVVLFLLFIAWLIIRFQNKRVKERMALEARNKQLVMAQRMKLLGVLAGGAVHDLKNLLTIILGYSDLVNDYSQDVSEDEKNEAVEIIKSTADTAFQVVSQILAFARQNYEETQVSDISDLLNEILDILKITVPRGIEIMWNPPQEKIYLPINPVKFKQVVMNLCLNAVQAMGEHGELKISLVNDMGIPRRIIIEISDTGPGIKPEYVDKIFDPLFTTKGEEKGSGLGLFVVKQIVDEYNGIIEVDNKPGEGVVFKISFPTRENT